MISRWVHLNIIQHHLTRRCLHHVKIITSHPFPHDQWEFQDSKMEVLHHIRQYFVVIFTCIGLKNRPTIYARYLHFRILKFPLTWVHRPFPMAHSSPWEPWIRPRSPLSFSSVRSAPCSSSSAESTVCGDFLWQKRGEGGVERAGFLEQNSVFFSSPFCLEVMILGLVFVDQYLGCFFLCVFERVGRMFFWSSNGYLEIMLNRLDAFVDF